MKVYKSVFGLWMVGRLYTDDKNRRCMMLMASYERWADAINFATKVVIG
jgi:hypothetical protein